MVRYKWCKRKEKSNEKNSFHCISLLSFLLIYLRGLLGWKHLKQKRRERVSVAAAGTNKQTGMHCSFLLLTSCVLLLIFAVFVLAASPLLAFNSEMNVDESIKKRANRFSSSSSLNHRSSFSSFNFSSSPFLPFISSCFSFVSLPELPHVTAIKLRMESSSTFASMDEQNRIALDRRSAGERI